MAYSAVSLFSGCGGFCEGARLAGFDVQAAVENDRFAVKTYKANFSEVPLYEGDVTAFLNDRDDRWTAVAAERFSHLVPGEVDLLFGGPPCQGFSQIGPRSLADPRNRLYLEYVRILEYLQPRVFIMENVPNMLWIGKGTFKSQVLEAFAVAGYSRVGVRVVSADNHGVPQTRDRAIFFGIRDDLDLTLDAGDWLDDCLAKEHCPGSNVGDAIGDLPERVSSTYDALAYPRSRRKSPFLDEMRLDRDGILYSRSAKMAASGDRVTRLYNHHTKEIQQRRSELLKYLKPGKKADSLPKEIWDGKRPEKWRRFHPDLPAHTLLAQMHRDLSEWVHPHHNRWITVREAARLQSFHDGFVFHSSEWQMLKQIGNAVPPLLARAVCSVAERALLEFDATEANPTEVDPPLSSALGG